MIGKTLAAVVLLAISALASCAEITQREKDLVVGKLRQQIHDNYILTGHVGAIDKTLDELVRSAPMKRASTRQEMAELLTGSLHRFDKHFGVQWRDQGQAPAKTGGEDWFARLGRKNSGFEKVEILDGNIGYVDFWGFDNVNDDSRARVARVMAMLVDTDAIIFDLRRNGGGSGDMVRLISSYLLEGKIHLNSFYWKPSDTTTEFWTLEDIDGKRRTEVPVYVLTSAETFSAAEEFAYNLQQLHRATIIGETTKGGANPWQFFDLGHGFRAAIPIAQAINPITKTNWEHVGVQPHVKATQAEAREVAYRMALSTLKGSTRNPVQLEEINKKLNELENAPGARPE